MSGVVCLCLIARIALSRPELIPVVTQIKLLIDNQVTKSERYAVRGQLGDILEQQLEGIDCQLALAGLYSEVEAKYAAQSAA